MTDFVTRDEFNSLHDDVREIRTDVKLLLLQDAGARAIARNRAGYWSVVASKATALYLIVAFVSLVVAALAYAHS